MTEQPLCRCFGATVRKDRMTAVERGATPTLEAAEAVWAAVAEDPALALAHYETRARDQELLRGHGFIEGAQYAVRLAGQCLGDVLTERHYLFADPARPIRSGQIALMKVRGDPMARAKIYLGRMAEIANEEQAFNEKPDGVYAFWQMRPAMMLAIAGQDLVAADLVFGKAENGSTEVQILPPDILTEDDRTRLAGTLAFLDRAALAIKGESVFEIEQATLLGYANGETIRQDMAPVAPREVSAYRVPQDVIWPEEIASTGQTASAGSGKRSQSPASGFQVVRCPERRWPPAGQAGARCWSALIRLSRETMGEVLVW